MSIKAVLIGARGYVGHELVSILSNHPAIDLLAASSRELAGQKIEGYHKFPLAYQNLSVDEVIELKPDVVLLALPNGLSHTFLQAIEQHCPETVVLDLSADNRFDDDWCYGLPEVYGQQASKRISNPGCYATAMQLSIAPVREFIDGQISCFGISGYSGAGTTPSDKNNPLLLVNNIMPYKLAEHLHEQEVSRHLNTAVKFSPHVAGFFRGISLTSHIPLKTSLDLTAVEKIYQDFYQDKDLIAVQKDAPQISQVAHQHSAIIGGWELSEDGQHLALSCTLDNLLKGAATQAIQNINLAFQLPLLAGIELK